ncbi:MAG: metallophosphoesterase [Fimbriimonadales bacterium]|nr:metallophosphoesterase [Fimbriimonadales bacterium]
MRVAHISDVHLGYRAYSRTNEHGMNQREHDVFQAFRRALRGALQAEPDLIVITGDLFHAVRPPNSSLITAYRLLLDVQTGRKGAPLVIIAGNHETPRVAESGCILALLSHIPGVQVVYDQITLLELPTISACLLCIPSRGVGEIEQRILEPRPDYRWNLLLLHGLLEGVTPFALERPIDKQKIVREEWDYIALGDWHLYTQVAPNALYAGATEFTSSNIWDEAGKPKGWILYDAAQRTHEFHPIPTRPVYDLTPIDATDLTAAELNDAIESRANALDRFDGAIVRQRIFNLLPELRSQIDGELLRELKTRALHYHLDLRPPRVGFRHGQSAHSDGDAASETRLTLVDEWRLFARDYPLPADIDREAFLELGARYLESGES